MTVDESKALTKGTRVYWRNDAADSGIITETSWDAVTIAWNNGQLARVHHGDMREIHRVSISQLSREPASPVSMKGRLSNTRKSRTRAKHRQRISRFNADLLKAVARR